MKRQTARPFCIALAVVGLAVLVVSFFWPRIVGGKRAWTEEQAKSYSAAAIELHRLTYEAAQAAEQEKKRGEGKGNPKASMSDGRLKPIPGAGAPDDPASATADRLAAQRTAAEQRYKTERDALDQARSQGEGFGAILRWLGIVLVATGIVGWAMGGSNSDE